jgi:hypothetical protein
MIIGNSLPLVKIEKEIPELVKSFNYLPFPLDVISKLKIKRHQMTPHYTNIGRTETRLTAQPVGLKAQNFIK